jgi:tyrosyl-tRNA synthetase
MSKSLGNAIGIQEPAAEMYGKLMSISDELMWRYWTFLTDKTQTEIDALQQAVGRGEMHPMRLKKDLAETITAGFHGAEAAAHVAEGWSTQFQQKGVAEDLPVVALALGTEGLQAPPIDGSTAERMLRMPKLLQLAGLVPSTGEGTRKLKENAVSINGEKFTAMVVAPSRLGEKPVLRLGKKAVQLEWTA